MYYIYIEGYTAEKGIRINNVYNLRAMEEFQPSMDLLRRMCNDLNLTNFIIIKASVYKIGEPPEIYYNTPTIFNNIGEEASKITNNTWSGPKIINDDLSDEEIDKLIKRTMIHFFPRQCNCSFCLAKRNK